MTAESSSYQIRLARLDEVARLQQVEHDAGALFAGLGLIDDTLDASFPLAELKRLIGLGQVWVACTADDLVVGAVITSVRDGTGYVEELDVLPAHGRRGLGARLLACVCTWAERQGYPAVTLSTFRDVPWNGPFYRKQGFRELAREEWTPGMQRIRALETRHGLQVGQRVFMRRELGATGATKS